jgi:hypothetical protein
MARSQKRDGLEPEQKSELLETLQERFERHPARHDGVSWADVRARLAKRPQQLCTLAEMERTGGEPDVVGVDEETGQLLFVDCSPESPSGRRSLCYDAAALASRKTAKPASSAQEVAATLGIELLTEARYRALQELGEFDTKTSSWIQTPADVRALGGALFCDRRFGRVFTYHNGAESYFAARGFRGLLRV